jgi:acetyltransferase
MRFFGAMRELPRSQLARFTQIDYDREMALVATLAPELSPNDSHAADHFLGEVRVVADPDNHTADFAIVVRSDIKGKGLGRLLMESIVDYAHHRGITLLRGETFAENLRMQHLASAMGFKLAPGDGGTVKLHLDLKPSPTT